MTSVYFNLDKSYIEILYRTKKGVLPQNVRPVRKNRWEPVLEDSKYQTERIFITGSITDITIGDLNSDDCSRYNYSQSGRWSKHIL
jgi:hypothetical protein